MADHIGQRLGNYQVMRLLGEGGFAQVYLGEHVDLGTQAAIKVLTTKISQEEVEQFRAEARTIARLKHLHIIGVLDYGVEAGVPFLIMQYAPGGTLRQRFPKGIPQAPVVILPYVQQLADALQDAHDHKLVHRDIKPENMLLDEQGEVVLSDFGIAVLALSSRLQNVQEVAGTAAYMAPEQIKGKAQYASDQYALGIVLYEWLAGERPFRGSLTELFAKHLHAPPPPLQAKAPLVSPRLAQVVLTALEKDPRARFASMRAFATAFEMACQEPVPLVVPPAARPVSQVVPTLVVPVQAGQPSSSLYNALTQQRPVGDPSPSVPLLGSYPAIFSLPTRISGPALEVGAALPEPKAPTSSNQPVAPGPEAPRRGVSRRVMLAGAAGLGGLAAVGGVAAWLGLSQRASTGAAQARATATATPWPTPTTSLTPAAMPTPTPSTLTRPLFTYRGHTQRLAPYALAWSPEPGVQRIASGAFDGVQVWDAFTGANAVPIGTPGFVAGLAWSPSGRQLAFSSNETAVADATNGAILMSYSQITGLFSLAWSPDGQRLAAGNYEPFVRVWLWQSSTPALWRGHAGRVNDVAWSPKGMYLASGSQDQTAIVWDTASGTPLKVLKAPETPAPVVAVSWSADESRLAVGDQNGTVWVWDALAGKQLYSRKAGNFGGGALALAWSPDGSRLAAYAPDGIEVWEAATGTLLVIIAGNRSGVFSLAWSPDGKYLASGNYDTTVQVWQPG